MAIKKGICINFSGCAQASANEPVEADTSEFFCPQCRRPLQPVARSGFVSWVVKGAAVLVVLGAAAALAIWLTRSPEPPPPPCAEGEDCAETSSAETEAALEALSQGSTLMARGEYQAGRDAFADATRLDCANAFAWANLGGAEMILGQRTAARRAYDEALRLDPDNWLAHYNLGSYYVRTEHHEEALDHLRRSLETLRRQGHLERAEAVVADLENNDLFTELRHDRRFQDLLEGH